MALSISTFVLRNATRTENQVSREEIRRRQDAREARQNRVSRLYDEMSFSNDDASDTAESGNTTPRAPAGRDEAAGRVAALTAGGAEQATTDVDEDGDVESGSGGGAGSGSGAGGDADGGANASSGSGEMAECRICQSDDLIKNLDAPCTCKGSLRYVHHKCLQQWCVEKGDTMCEICKTPFKGNYTAPLRRNSHQEAGPNTILGWVIPERTFVPDRSQATTLYCSLCSKPALSVLLALLLLHTALLFITQSDEVPAIKYILDFLLRILIFLLPFCKYRAATTRARSLLSSLSPCSC